MTNTTRHMTPAARQMMARRHIANAYASENQIEKLGRMLELASELGLQYEIDRYTSQITDLREDVEIERTEAKRYGWGA